MITGSQESSVCMGLMTKEPESDFWQVQETFSSPQHPGANQVSLKYINRAPSFGVKWPGKEAKNSPFPSADDKTMGIHSA